MMIQAASSTGGLSRDAIHSLASLARGQENPNHYLEDVLEVIEFKNREGIARLLSFKRALKDNGYMD